MNNLTIKQLRYFEALVTHGHFGQAAEACAISQPALSMQIKELEEALGAVLFERTPKRVRTTALGEDFAKRARQILQSIDELTDIPRTHDDALIGRLRLGVIPTIAPYLLPNLIDRISQSYPALDLRIRETMTDNLINELIDGGIDAAIVALPVSEPSLEELALFKEDFVLVRPSADKGSPVPSGSELHQMKLLLLEEGHCFRDQALSYCNVSSTRPWDGLDGSSLTTLVQLVAAGLGVTLVPEMAIDVETRSRDVDIARFSEPVPSRTIGMIWRKTNPLAEKLLLIAQIVKSAAKRNEV